MIDTRREANQIARQFRRYHRQIGEAVLWFLFDVNNSHYHDVYDEAYRQYEPARKVPILWVDQQEAAVDYSPEGRRPTQRIRLACGARLLWESGVQVSEAHGNRLSDKSPSDVWREDRLNDIFYYDGRFYSISGFQVKGRLQDQDCIIGITGIETFPGDELNLEVVPPEWFPSVADPVPPRSIEHDLDFEVFFGVNPPHDPRAGILWLTPDGVTTPGDPLGYDLDTDVSYGPNPPDDPAVGEFWLDTDEEP